MNVAGRAAFFALAVFALGACSQAQKNAFVHIGEPSVPKSSITSVTMSRHGCYGGCPIYTLTFSRGDSAVYDGKLYVDKVGKYEGKVDFDLIAAWLDSQDVDAYAGHYGTNVIDAERATLTISRSNQIIVIDSDYAGSLPVRVRGVLASIDGFAKDVRWNPANAIDSYLGYFLNENTPGKAFGISVGQGDSILDAQGYTEVVYCSAGEFIDEQQGVHVHLIGSRAVGQQTSYGGSANSPRLQSPINMAIEVGGLRVRIGGNERSYRRVTSSEYGSMLFKSRTHCQAP